MFEYFKTGGTLQGTCRYIQNLAGESRIHRQLSQISAGIFAIYFAVDTRDQKSAQCGRWLELNYNNVGYSVRLKTNFELNPVTEVKQGTLSYFTLIQGTQPPPPLQIHPPYSFTIQDKTIGGIWHLIRVSNQRLPQFYCNVVCQAR